MEEKKEVREGKNNEEKKKKQILLFSFPFLLSLPSSLSLLLFPLLSFHFLHLLFLSPISLSLIERKQQKGRKLRQKSHKEEKEESKRGRLITERKGDEGNERTVMKKNRKQL